MCHNPQESPLLKEETYEVKASTSDSNFILHATVQVSLCAEVCVKVDSDQSMESDPAMGRTGSFSTWLRLRVSFYQAMRYTTGLCANRCVTNQRHDYSCADRLLRRAHCFVGGRAGPAKCFPSWNTPDMHTEPLQKLCRGSGMRHSPLGWKARSVHFCRQPNSIGPIGRRVGIKLHSRSDKHGRALRSRTSRFRMSVALPF